MSRLSVSDWIQILGASAIAIGLLLVLYELQQGREIAGTQLISDRFTALSSHYDALMGENPSAVLAKACLSPDELSLQELEVLQAYFNAKFLVIRRMHVLRDQGDYASSEPFLEGWAAGTFTTIFGQPYGRLWWQQIRRFWVPIFPDVVALGDDMLANAAEDYACSSFWRDISPNAVARDS